jgi:uncharacterized membrane protein
MSRLLRDAAAVLGIAVVVHVAAIVAVPRAVMHVVFSRAAQAGGANAPVHAHRPTAADRGIPLPSPDLLYSICALDVAKGPVSISVTPGSTYLSVSVFDERSDNVFVTSDRDAGGKPIKLLIVGDRAGITAPADTTVVVLPGGKGVLLLRGLAATPEMAAESDRARRTLACTKVK